MSKGRNTTMLGLRIRDELMVKLDKKCKELKCTRSELLIPMIEVIVDDECESPGMEDEGHAEALAQGWLTEAPKL